MHDAHQAPAGITQEGALLDSSSLAVVERQKSGALAETSAPTDISNAGEANSLEAFIQLAKKHVELIIPTRGLLLKHPTSVRYPSGSCEEF